MNKDIDKIFADAHEEVRREREIKKADFMRRAADAAEKRRRLTELKRVEEEYWRRHPLTEEEKNQYKEVLQNLREKNKNKHNTEE